MKLDLLAYSHVEDPENNVFKSGIVFYIAKALRTQIGMILIVFSFSIFVDVGVSQTSNGQASPKVDNGNSEKDPWITWIGIVVASFNARVPIFVAYKGYKKGKEAQAIEHKNRLEYNYSRSM